MKTDIQLWSYLAQFFLESEMSQTKLVEKIKTHLMFHNILSENRADYELMRLNTVEPAKSQIAIWHMRTEFWIPRLQHTQNM